MFLGLLERAEIPFFLPEPLWFWSLLLHPLCLDLHGIFLRYGIISSLWTCSFPLRSIGRVCDRWEKKTLYPVRTRVELNIQNVRLMNSLCREERCGLCLQGKSPAHTERCRATLAEKLPTLSGGLRRGRGAILLYDRQSHCPHHGIQNIASEKWHGAG